MLRNQVSRTPGIAALNEAPKTYMLHVLNDAGNRVAYVYVETADPDCKNQARADDPVFVREKQIPIDYVYTMNHVFLNPVCLLLDPLLGVDNPQHQRLAEKTRTDKRREGVIQQILDDTDIKGLLAQAKAATSQRRRDHLNAKNRQRTISSFYTPRS